MKIPLRQNLKPIDRIQRGWKDQRANEDIPLMKCREGKIIKEYNEDIPEIKR